MEEPGLSSRLPDWRAIAVLTLIAAGLRAWQLTHTEVTSRDSIAYIRIAWQLGHGDWRTVIPRADHHPGYPVAVLAVSQLVCPLVPGDLPRAMQLSAQLASSLAGVLLVVPMYFLGRELFGRRVAFWTALLFQCLPAGGRVLGDGLSEGLFLLLAVSSLTVTCQALRTGWLTGFGLAGLFSALAYLTRPEGAAVALAAGLALLGTQAVRGRRRPWGRCLACGTALTLGFLAGGGPFMALIGKVSLNHTGKMIREMAENERPAGPAGCQAVPVGVTAGPALWAVWNDAVWDHNHPVNQSLLSRVRWAFRAFPVELIKGYFYVLWVPVLLGLVWFRDRFRVVPGAWAVLALCLILAVVLFLVAVVGAYLSDRHLLLIILCGLYWGVAAVEAIGAGAADLLARRRAPREAGRLAGAWAPGLLVLLCALPLVRTLAPLHADRTGFREAGHWLAENARPEDEVEDPYAWASYYAGRVFQPGPMKAPTCYIVLEDSGNAHAHYGDNVQRLAERARGGEVVRRWPVPRGKAGAEVRIYAVRN
jgi:hypothetical protein